MRFIFIFSLLVPFLIKAQTNPIHTKAKLTEVQVFINQAQLTSEVKTIVPAGVSTLYISNIASTTDPNSIQMNGLGDAIILSTQFLQNFVEIGSKNKELAIYQDSLQVVADQLLSIKYIEEGLQNEKQLLASNYSTNGANIGNSPEKVKAMADFYRSRFNELTTALLKNEKAKQELQKKKNLYEKQIAQYNQAPMPQGGIRLEIMAKAKTNLNFNLEYVAYNAYWNINYDLKVKDTKSPISIGARANVWQNTGISWENVKLTLGTTNPSANNTTPELYPMTLSFVEPIQLYKKDKARSNAILQYSDDIQIDGIVTKAAVPAPMESAANYTSIEDTGLDTKYIIELPYTVSTDGQPTRVAIQEYSTPASYTYYAVPKAESNAFLLAEIVEWEKLNLIPGIAKIYFNGSYRGETTLSTELGDTLKLGIGRDQKILIKRELLKELSSTKSIGNTTKTEKSFKITLRNTQKESVALTLLDQIPVSTNKDIEILDLKVDGAEMEANTGILKWKLNLKSAEIKEIKVSYTVKYPKDKKINNL
jgi:uncharacterized protein (TIGR02231 family)